MHTQGQKGIRLGFPCMEFDRVVCHLTPHSEPSCPQQNKNTYMHIPFIMAQVQLILNAT